MNELHPRNKQVELGGNACLFEMAISWSMVLYHPAKYERNSTRREQCSSQPDLPQHCLRALFNPNSMVDQYLPSVEQNSVSGASLPTLRRGGHTQAPSALLNLRNLGKPPTVQA